MAEGFEDSKTEEPDFEQMSDEDLQTYIDQMKARHKEFFAKNPLPKSGTGAKRKDKTEPAFREITLDQLDSEFPKDDEEKSE